MDQAERSAKFWQSVKDTFTYMVENRLLPVGPPRLMTLQDGSLGIEWGSVVNVTDEEWADPTVLQHELGRLLYHDLGVRSRTFALTPALDDWLNRRWVAERAAHPEKYAVSNG